MQQSLPQAERTVSTDINQLSKWESLIGNVYNHPTFTNGARITMTIIKTPSSVQQNMSVETCRGTRYLLTNTTFLTNPAGKDTKCDATD